MSTIESFLGSHDGTALRAPVDPVVRKLDKHGNEIQLTYIAETAKFEDVSLKSFWLYDALRAIFQDAPIDVADVADYYEHRLRPAIREARAEYEKAWAWVDERNLEAMSYNASVTIGVEALRRQHAGEIEQLHHLETSKRAEFDAARRTACEKAALAGYCLDPAKLDEAPLLGIPERTDRGLSGKLKVAHVPDDQKALLSDWVAVGLSAVSGGMLGLGIGSMIGLIHLSRGIVNDPPWLLILCGLVGFAISYGTAYAVRGLFRLTFLAIYQGQPRRVWISWLVTSISLTVSVLALDALAEQLGLLKSSQLAARIAGVGGDAAAQSAVAHQTPGWVWFAVGLIIQFGYLVYQATHGITSSHVACTNRATAHREQEVFDLAQAARQKPEVREALVPLALSLAIKQELVEIDEALVKTTERFGAQIQTEVGRLKEIRSALTPELARHVKIAVNNANGAQQCFDKILARLMSSPPTRSSYGHRRRSLRSVVRTFFAGIGKHLGFRRTSTAAPSEW